MKENESPTARQDLARAVFIQEFALTGDLQGAETKWRSALGSKPDNLYIRPDGDLRDMALDARGEVLERELRAGRQKVNALVTKAAAVLDEFISQGKEGKNRALRAAMYVLEFTFRGATPGNVNMNIIGGQGATSGLPDKELERRAKAVLDLRNQLGDSD